MLFINVLGHNDIKDVLIAIGARNDDVTGSHKGGSVYIYSKEEINHWKDEAKRQCLLNAKKEDDKKKPKCNYSKRSSYIFDFFSFSLRPHPRATFQSSNF